MAGLGSATYAEADTGLLGAGGELGTRRHREETAREIDLEVRRIVGASFERAVELLEHNRGIIERSARDLLEAETLDEPALRMFFDEIAEPR